MKKIVTSIAVISLLAACGEKAAEGKVDYAVLSGKVSSVDAKGENQKLLLLQNDEVVKEIPVQADGTFRDTIREIGDNHFYYLVENPAVQTPLYLANGTNMELTLNEEVSKTMVSGSQTKQTQYLIERNSFINDRINGADSNLFGQKPQEFKENVKAFFAELDKKLKAYGFDEEFVKNQEKWTNYKFVEYLTIFPTYHRYTSGNEAILPDDFYAERDGIDYDNAEEFRTIDTYRDLVRSKFYTIINNPNDAENIKKFISEVNALKSDNIRADLAKGTFQLISPNSTVNKEIFDFINKNVTDEKVKEAAKKAYDVATKLTSGSPSPKFSNYENFNGGTTSLDDFKGKVTYIDIWATWCLPCRGEIPALKELEKKFHGKDVAFVSISIDQNKDEWKEFVKSEDLKGVQLFAENAFESQFIQDYGIRQIPTFIIIDKEGKIVNADAPRPSSDEITGLLEGLLKK
ncbi:MULTISPECIES: TlpA family protein disulfide reductase [Capnocytophaga]|jgi:alkyl hydroperoxide reductase/ thiol specific antioxidant/ mal allergen|uniref:TlpA family protein disulfide reductase n=1 Tax=Capnocytophaga TaxID=1016 RepID=UPI00027C6034|nr:MULTISPECIES: TlpA disulfide reductase family protein [Capnocytophaga]EJU31217.1 redoxin [Capnocytophaga sp. CM59]RKW06097.1 MAG: TlpA family protein disulfide reductase [Capnocytophaga sp.]